MSLQQLQPESEGKCSFKCVEKLHNFSHSHSQQQTPSSSSSEFMFQVHDSSQMQTKIPQIQKSTNEISENSIMIYISSPNNQIRIAYVFLTDSIDILNSIFQGDQKVYFFNGNILNPHHSFGDCGISNGDRIVTVPVEQMNLNVEAFWRKATRNGADDKERLNGLNDCQTKFVFAKNNDLTFFKAESRPASNRRLMKTLMFLINDKSSTISNTNISFFPPEKISETPLPVLW